MPGKSTTFDNQLLGLIFNATAIANIAINHTTAPLTNLYVSLHQTTPGAGGSQNTNEASYSGYARVAISRVGTANGWTVSGASVSPISNITFPTSTGTPSETESFFAIGTTSAGAGEILYFGAISPVITVNAAGITPTLVTTSVVTES